MFATLMLQSIYGQGPRAWTDAFGKYKIEAEYVSESDGTVVLKRSDGKRFEIKLDRLSDTDRDLIKKLKSQQAAASPFRARLARRG